MEVFIMKYSYVLVFSLLSVFSLLALVPPDAWSEEVVDNSLYAELLAKYVKDGVVDYQGFKKEEQKLDQYLDLLDKTDPAELSRNEQYAYYINVYNVYTLKLILDNFKDGKPLDSIKDIGGLFKSPWKIDFVKAGGKVYKLDDIEHNVLRPTFKDPRVHFAVNCASKSCPPLISVPYQGDTLDQQLDENTISFLNDSKHNYLDGNLYTSAEFSNGLAGRF